MDKYLKRIKYLEDQKKRILELEDAVKRIGKLVDLSLEQTDACTIEKTLKESLILKEKLVFELSKLK